MQELVKAIEAAATERVRAHERRKRQAYDETFRRQRRSTCTIRTLEARRPAYWEFDPSHDPYHVRAKSKSIGHAIERVIKSGAYAPYPPAGFAVPKPNGTTRAVTAFAIADEVVSKRLYKALFVKNRARLSARSYAYREDLSVQDALVHLQSEWADEHRLFVAQYDFQDFFGSIDHDHVWSTISSIGLAITRTERRLLESFMRAPHPTMLPATMPATALEPRSRGVHQGTTISLLVANIAATPLDREFERLGVSFTRYADDIVIWSRDYNALNRAVDHLHRFADESRCRISRSKSPGVSLLVEPEAGEGEFRTVHSVPFLSHEMALRSVSISDRSIESSKRTMSSYIYNHLLREPIAGTQKMDRLQLGLDRDYVALLSQLRRFVYGSLSEEQLRRLLRGPLPPMISLGGLLGRYPIANNTSQLRDLDAWLSTQVWLALRKRAKLLGGLVNPQPEPWGLEQADLATFMTRSTKHRVFKVDGRLPSSVRMSELVRRAVRAHGTRIATHKPSLYDWGD